MLLLTNRLRIRGRFTDQVDPVKGFRFFEFPENGLGETPSELTIRKAVAKITPAAVALTPSSLPGEVLINVHGYNNSLSQAWERTQGFHSRLSEGGYHSFPICVSWPSNGRMTGYLDDRLDTQNSVPSFVNFLANLHEEVQLGNPRCTVNLNLIAHSMGSLLVRDGIQELWKRQGMPVSFPMLNEVLLVGSDIDAFFRDQIEFGASSEGVSVYELLEIALNKRPEFLRHNDDPAAKKLFTALRRNYDDNEVRETMGLSFDDYILYCLKHKRKEIAAQVRRFEESCEIATLVELSCLQKHQDHKVVFIIDNIDSLLDSDSIHNAICLLVRADALVGKHGLVLVASRPRSFYSHTRNLVPLPDAGHNLYETIHISDYLRKVVLPSDDSLQYSDEDVIEFANAQEATNFYWSMLLRRLEFVLEAAVEKPVVKDRDLTSVVVAIRQMFDGNSFCADLITGISNHSFRSFLISVITFIDKLLREYRQLPAIQLEEKSNSDFSRAILGASSLSQADRNTSALLYSQLCHYVGQEGGSLPGVDMYRLKIGRAVDHFKRNGQPVTSDIVPFYIMKFLNGCQVARYLEDGTITSHSQSVSVARIISGLQMFGFTKEEVHGSVGELILPDRWDLPILDFADQGTVVRGEQISLDAQVQLEARGWMIANIFPFRFHYWLGDLQAHFGEVADGVESVQSLRRVARAIEYMVHFAEMELAIVARAPSEWSLGRKVEEYGKLTHVHSAFCYRKVFDLARSYWGRYLSNLDSDQLNDSYAKQIGGLIQLLPRMKGTIDSMVEARLADGARKEGLLYGPEFSAFRDWKRTSEGL